MCARDQGSSHAWARCAGAPTIVITTLAGAYTAYGLTGLRLTTGALLYYGVPLALPGRRQTATLPVTAALRRALQPQLRRPDGERPAGVIVSLNALVATQILTFCVWLTPNQVRCDGSPAWHRRQAAQSP